jgi:hypothetical protein
MKNMRTATICLSLIFALLNLNAQDISEVIESEYPFSSGTKHVYQVEVSNGTIDQFKTAINEGLKTYKAKLKSVKGADEEYYIEDINIPDISHQPISAFYKLQQLATGARMMVHVLEGGEPVTSESASTLYENAMAYPERIGGRVSVMLLNGQLEGKQELLEEKNKELTALNDDKLAIETEISEANNTIMATEGGIKENDSKIEGIQTEIELRNSDMQGFQMELAH